LDRSKVKGKKAEQRWNGAQGTRKNKKGVGFESGTQVTTDE